MTDPWDEISSSDDAGTIHLRRADPDHPLDLFRGRDHEGNYIFSFKGKFAEQGLIELPKLATLAITLEHREDDLWEFSIYLLEKSHSDIFRALCADLMTATNQLRRSDDHAGVEIMLARLRRWRELLKVRRDKRLSDAQVIGLFGELLLLRDIFLKNLPPLEAVAAWRGPHGDEQDFLFGDWLIELKTQLSSADSKLQISSENQLDSKSGRILICHQKLGIESKEAGKARTLNSLVTEVDELLGGNDVGARDRFLATLIEYGYAKLPEYEANTWVLNKRGYFRVGDGFPRITSADLPPGVEAVQYSIKLESCEGFRVAEGKAIDWLFSRHE